MKTKQGILDEKYKNNIYDDRYDHLYKDHQRLY